MQAYKGRDEEYKLFWPQQSEFVRMAAKFGATIVPFAAIGLDDSFNMVLDGSDIRNIPVVGDAIASRAAKLPQARRCEAKTYLILEIFVNFCVESKSMKPYISMQQFHQFLYIPLGHDHRLLGRH